MAEIDRLYNPESIVCPKCRLANHGVRPVSTRIITIKSPQDAWEYPFLCDNCNIEYPLERVAVFMSRFEDWFSQIFPGQPKPWVSQEREAKSKEVATSVYKDCNGSQKITMLKFDVDCDCVRNTDRGRGPRG